MRRAAVALLLAACAAGAHAARSKAVVDDPAYAQPTRLVDVGDGRRLNLHCSGDGAPTVVFDAGLANWSQIWGLVQPVVARTTRACSYDRAGLGFSDAATRAGTSANIADDLHRLLHAAGIAPPYVLVGHSYGGMNVRMFANLYRDEVAGLVLDDPSHEEHFLRVARIYPEVRAIAAAERAHGDRDAQACIDAARAGFVPGTRVFAQCVSGGSNPRYLDAISAVYARLQTQPSFLEARLSEEQAFDGDSAAQLRLSRRGYGDLPMIVLTRALSDLPSGLPVDEQGLLVYFLHEDLAGLSRRGVHRLVPESSHDIHFDQPQAGIDAILEVVAAARNPAGARAVD